MLQRKDSKAYYAVARTVPWRVILRRTMPWRNDIEVRDIAACRTHPYHIKAGGDFPVCDYAGKSLPEQ